MIVDDEKLVVEDLMSIVDWESLGFVIVATAVNGKQALNKYRKFSPQVIFTDIRMPFMDGIELIEHIRENDSATEIVLLSAYSDFSYAQSAIKNGLADYMIKSTINRETVADLLGKLKDRIRRKEKIQALIKEKTIAGFMNYGQKEETDDEPLLGVSCYYLLFEQDNPLNLSPENKPEELYRMKAEAIEILKSGNGSDYDVEAVSLIAQNRCLVMLHIRENSGNTARGILEYCAMEKKSKLEKALQRSYTVYLVSQKCSLVKFREIYRKNTALFLQKYFRKQREVVDLLESVPPVKPQERTIVPQPAIQLFLERNKKDELLALLKGIFDQLGRNQNYQELCEVSRELYEILKLQYKCLPEFAERPDLGFEKNWRMWVSAHTLEQWFAQMFERLLEARAQVNETVYGKDIMRAIEFIGDHYSDRNLSIKMVADSVHLSTGHLCVLFKKETGRTLNNYITEVRMEEAKRLLTNTQMKIYEIAVKVGYQSSQYFSQIFLRQTGCSPAEYRKGKRADGE